MFNIVYVIVVELPHHVMNNIELAVYNSSSSLPFFFISLTVKHKTFRIMSSQGKDQSYSTHLHSLIGLRKHSRKLCLVFGSVVIFLLLLSVIVYSSVIMSRFDISGSVTVGGNVSISLRSNGFDSEAIKGITITPHQSVAADITYHVGSCYSEYIRNITLPLRVQNIITSNQSPAPVNYYNGNIPLYTINSGSITYTANYSKTICLSIFTDINTYQNYITNPVTPTNKYCLHQSTIIGQATPSSTGTLPLSETGFYFITVTTSEELGDTVPVQVNISANVQLYYTPHSKSGRCSERSCYIDLSGGGGGSVCVFIQMKDYQTISYAVSHTPTLVGLITASVIITVIIVIMIIVIMFITWFLLVDDSNTDIENASASNSTTKLHSNSNTELPPRDGKTVLKKFKRQSSSAHEQHKK